MANDLNSEIFGAVNLGSSLSVVGEVILWTLIVVLVLALAYLVYYLFSFRNTLILRDATNGFKIIKKARWKEKRDKNNNIWLVTPFNRLKKPLPPSKSIEITPKGKKWVEAWRGEDTETLIWATDTFNYNTYKEEHPEFQPLTTQERELLVNEIAKSHAYKTKSTAELILQISLIMAPIILIAVIGLTLGDITEALVQYSQPLTNSLTSVAESFENSANALAGVQNAPDVLEVPN